jgi:hypothetical protein
MPAPILISSKLGVALVPTVPASTNGTKPSAPPSHGVWTRASADASTSERPPVGSPWLLCGPIAW